MDVRDLQGLCALVTGTASGIGRATALAFAQRRASLILCDIDGVSLGEAERDPLSVATSRPVVWTWARESCPPPAQSARATTKFAALVPSDCLRAALAPFGIGVIAVCPGFIDTSIVERSRLHGVAADPENRRHAKPKPTNRLGENPGGPRE